MGQVLFVTLPKCQMEDLSTKLTNNVVERLRHRQVNRPLSIGTPLSKTKYQCSVYHIGHCSRSLEHQSTCFCLRMSVCFGIIGCSCELMAFYPRSRCGLTQGQDQLGHVHILSTLGRSVNLRGAILEGKKSFHQIMKLH